MLDHLVKAFDWDVKIVNYDGASERQATMLGGHVDMGMSGLMSSINAGERVLVVWSDERNALLPDVPTMSKLLGKDVPFVAASRFIGVRASFKGKYPERYAVLLDTLEKAYRNPDYQEALERTGRSLITHWYGPEESGRIHKKQHEIVLENKDILGDF